MTTKIFKLLSIVMAAAMLLGMTACVGIGAATPTVAPQPPAATAVPATQAPTAPPAPTATTQPRVLNLWYYEPPDGALGKAWAASQTQFLSTHPESRSILSCIPSSRCKRPPKCS